MRRRRGKGGKSSGACPRESLYSYIYGSNKALLSWLAEPIRSGPGGKFVVFVEMICPVEKDGSLREEALSLSHYACNFRVIARERRSLL